MEYIKVGSDGFVRFVDKMGGEGAILQAARVSYGKIIDDSVLNGSDIKLLRYLMRHRHTTPFEMVEVKFHVRVPMDTWRQWIRHRTASVNEYSTRYTEAIDSRETVSVWRAQATDNKQGSSGIVDSWPEGYGTFEADGRWFVSVKGQIYEDFSWDHEPTPGEWLSHREALLHASGSDVYKERLDFGVAKELARKDLPLSTYTEAYWKIDLHNLLHFLSLRMDSHAQQEIREFANSIGWFIKSIYPNVWQAFKDYRLDAMVLTGPEIRAILGGACELEGRENDEFQRKLERLGL